MDNEEKTITSEIPAVDTSIEHSNAENTDMAAKTETISGSDKNSAPKDNDKDNDKDSDKDSVTVKTDKPSAFVITMAAIIGVITAVGKTLAKFMAAFIKFMTPVVKSEPFRLTFMLFAITSVTSLLLGFVYILTADTIAANTEAKLNSALRAVTSETAVFKNVEPGDNDIIEAVKTVTDGGEALGYCVIAVPKGFSAEIRLLIGFDNDGKVTSVTVLGQSETPGVGTRIDSPEFLSQFNEKKFQLEVNSKISEKNIDAVSGATISSRAVTSGVNEAISIIENILKEGK